MGTKLLTEKYADDMFGVLLAVSHQVRKVQVNQIATAGWRGGQTISNARDGVLFSNAYIPRNWDQIIDEQDRKRTNASLVLQFAPSEDVTITLDGLVSKFEVDSQVTDLASWFEPDRVVATGVGAGCPLRVPLRVGALGARRAHRAAARQGGADAS